MDNQNSTIKQAEDMKSSLIWSTIVNELERKIWYETQKLRSCQPEDLKDIQCKIQAYESLKRLPDEIIERESTQ